MRAGATPPSHLRKEHPLGLNTSSSSSTASHVSSPTSGTTMTLDMKFTDFFTVTLTGNCTFTFINPRQGHVYYLRLIQDSTGSRTATWPSSLKWSGGTAPTLTTTAARSDLVTMVYDATSLTFYGQTTILNFT